MTNPPEKRETDERETDETVEAAVEAGEVGDPTPQTPEPTGPGYTRATFQLQLDVPVDWAEQASALLQGNMLLYAVAQAIQSAVGVPSIAGRVECQVIYDPTRDPGFRKHVGWEGR